ncbi:APC family permease [Companilactobacillus halodurans]|uniref:Amino acid permease n=1 Tax=Companilactobacillus halodurans TaxID=2584183 RepID=A0A5P0ZZS7_9LACO|nr:amino acid permease [Companilactobacillus halodurans]MQS98385.1 amino acid permease [Companilactobacillus halodurans]
MKEKLFKKADFKEFAAGDAQFEKILTRGNLISMGIGAIIGTGIFILPGIVAYGTTGPSITISFILAAIVCILTAMCFAELSSTFPVAGSTYSYGSIIFGQFPGWLIGWALCLEYTLGVSAVSSGFSAYFVSLFNSFGVVLPKALVGPFDPSKGTFINLPAIIVLILIYLLLRRGIQASARMNTVMVFVKIAVILTFIVIGLFYIKPENYHPYFPHGGLGVVKGAALVFFAYLGFDVIPSSAPEVKDPQKNIPISIMVSLAVCAILYVILSAVLTGMVNYKDLNYADPVVYALNFVKLGKVAFLITVGALAGMFTMMLNTVYGGSRLIYALGRDGMIPNNFGKIDSKAKTPILALNTITILAILLGGFVSLNELTSLVNIGTLVSFTFVALGIIKLRHRSDVPKSDFKVPFYPWLPIISVVLCVLLMTQVSINSWIAFIAWFLIGIIVYFCYGYRKVN